MSESDRAQGLGPRCARDLARRHHSWGNKLYVVLKLSKSRDGAPGYDQLAERRFEFIPLSGVFVFLLYTMRRVNCRRCGIVAVEEVPWGDGKRTLTRAYMLFLVYQIDLDVTRLLWVGRERTIESFRGVFTVIGDELASKIVFVCSDMWDPT